jgi:hypothetical protein
MLHIVVLGSLHRGWRQRPPACHSECASTCVRDGPVLIKPVAEQPRFPLVVIENWFGEIGSAVSDLSPRDPLEKNSIRFLTAGGDPE